jgi:hypothetical protein
VWTHTTKATPSSVSALAFTLQWLMDERLPREGERADTRGAIPA